MKPKPMTFTKQMVPLIMAGLKTQSRRIMRVQPPTSLSRIEGTYIWTYTCSGPDEAWKPPHQPGDIVYAAEGYRISSGTGPDDLRIRAILRKLKGVYLADNEKFNVFVGFEAWWKWNKRKYPYRAGRFMYRSLARTWLEILDVRAERIQDISMKACIAEGILTSDKGGPERLGRIMYTHLPGDHTLWELSAKKAFRNLWNSIHGPDAWDRNDMVWTYKFKQIEKPREELKCQQKAPK